MRDSQIIKKWCGNGCNIVFWGSSNRSTEIIAKTLKMYPDIYNYDVVDNNYTGMVRINDKDVSVYGWEYFKNKTDCKFVLCQTILRSYRDIRYFLEEKGYRENIDYVDYENLIDPGEWKRAPYFYSDCTVYGAYSPWENDITFLKIYKRICDNTLVDIYRLYELWSIVQETSKCTEGDILEVGVWRGGTGAVIATAAQYAGIDSVVYLVDTFEGVVKASEADNIYIGGEHSDTNMEHVKKLLNENGLNKTEVFKGIFPEAFNERFETTLWRFIHIDVDTYLSARDIFNYCWGNVIKGGCVVFDDYGCNSTSGITKLCNEIKLHFDDGMFYYNLNGHAIFIKG